MGGESPLLIWDATPAVVDIVAAKSPRSVALHQLEGSAIDVALQRLATMKRAKRITVRLIYQKIGAVNPEYGAATLTGVERVFELTADASAIRSDHVHLTEMLTQGNVPPGIHLVLNGELPPDAGVSH